MSDTPDPVDTPVVQSSNGETPVVDVVTDKPVVNVENTQNEEEKKLPQVDTKFVPNPTGKGGFREHPENRNTQGVKAEWTWRTLLLQIGEEMTPLKDDTGKVIGMIAFKERVAKKLWVKSSNGDTRAMELLMNRTEGMPVQTTQFQGVDGNSLEIKITEDVHTDAKNE